ncbi:hypothetical protein [Bacillus amyloliquefaciens]|uniref:hypothetical protein n=1 Tax=Bacillus amyloliquefaciens TaxID=1390 RepID=UPI00073B6E6B|nr:hypothetical protein [Bacillus amyloliquefaciens]KTF59830.1 hypothetical protein AR691_13950 [Bacillus amyloliquefaciens]
MASVAVVSGDLIVANGTVVVANGIIRNNPFSSKIVMSEATQWMIRNEDVVKKSIWYWFRHCKVSGGNVDDCFEYGLNYFIEKKKRAFRKFYFGKESSYGIENYVLSSIRNVVQEYRSRMNDGHKVVPFVTSEETDQFGAAVGKVEETVGSDTIVETGEMVVESDEKYWDERFEWLAVSFQQFVEDRQYKVFSVEDYLYYMFLRVDTADIEKHRDTVAKKCGESKDLIKMVTRDFQMEVRDGKEYAADMLVLIKELLDGVQAGWKPLHIREGVRMLNGD